jgi:hypothetical protein
MKTVPFYEKKIPRKLCEEIDKIADSENMPLARRPWNRFKATTSSWWLVPSHIQPHHQFGKYLFDWGDRDFNTLITGFYAEKGLDRALKAVYPSRKGTNLLMNSKWIWNELEADFKNGAFHETISNIASGIPFSVEFHIEGGYVEDPMLFDPYSSTLANDLYIMELNSADLSLEISKAVRKGMCLKALNRVNTLEKLSAQLAEYSADQWLWLNFTSALRFNSPMNNSPSPKSVVWNGRDIWRNFLVKFKKWIH